MLYLINQTSIAQGSNYNRLVLQELAIDFFMTHPLFGTGVGTFINNASQVSYYMVEFGGVIDSHSMFFKVLSETGVIGIVTFYTFIIGLVIYILKALSQARHTHYAQLLATLTASTTAVFVFENFGTSYYQSQMWLPIGLLLVAVGLANRELARKVL
ncbi:O-antigen ligase family protein [Candidatus Falkowbacteria bacterium]|nr:O-antigen ligase family protein [Candidatus Falkowbacteria bacterium]